MLGESGGVICEFGSRGGVAGDDDGVLGCAGKPGCAGSGGVNGGGDGGG